MWSSERLSACACSKTKQYLQWYWTLHFPFTYHFSSQLITAVHSVRWPDPSPAPANTAAVFSRSPNFDPIVLHSLETSGSNSFPKGIRHSSKECDTCSPTGLRNKQNYCTGFNYTVLGSKVPKPLSLWKTRNEFIRWFLHPKSISKAVHLLTSSQTFIFWTVNSQYLDSFTMWVLNVWRRSLLSAIFPVFPLSSSTPRIILLSHASRVFWSKWHSSEKLEHNERILELGGFSAVQKVIKKTHWEQYHFTLSPPP